MTNLSGYRTHLDNILATAVDASTWTDAIFDQSLRQALQELNSLLVYEETFTVASTGYEQTISITDLLSITALAWPWYDGFDFHHHMVPWRLVEPPNKVYFIHAEPQSGDSIRVRFNKEHHIENLDSATSTTVPDTAEQLTALLAAEQACTLRIRQISENPAIPQRAMTHLQAAAADFREQAQRFRNVYPAAGPIRWGDMGLEDRRHGPFGAHRW